MGTLEAINTLVGLASAVANTVAQIGQVSGIIHQAQAENRTELTDSEMGVITGIDDAARAQLVAALTKALAK